MGYQEQKMMAKRLDRDPIEFLADLFKVVDDEDRCSQALEKLAGHIETAMFEVEVELSRNESE